MKRILMFVGLLPVLVVAYLIAVTLGYAVLLLSAFGAPVHVWKLVTDWCEKR